ncbi:MAG: hypothetical protein WDN69_28780 [Aliidongia sp.]
MLEDIEMRGFSADTVGAAAEAVAIARELSDLPLLARALYCAVEANLAAGNWETAVVVGEEAARAFARNGDRLGEYKARYLIGGA